MAVTKLEVGFLGGHYSELLLAQTFGIRRQIAHEVAKTALKAALSNGFNISSIEGVNLIFGELCDVIVRDQKDGGLFGQKIEGEIGYEAPIDWEDILEEQSLVSRLIHLIKLEDGDSKVEFEVILVKYNLVS